MHTTQLPPLLTPMGAASSNRTSSLLKFPCYLRISKTTGLTIRFQRETYSPESSAKEADHKNLSWQSWGFQERLLSRRIIHFGSKFLFFECKHPHRLRSHARWPTIPTKAVRLGTAEKKKTLSFEAMLSTRPSTQ
jgi:hypothetical protein